ncbi:UNVERIFIED_CONTAM: hypothetical protein FKN15_052230 [Acipenser sinensis]
MADKPKRRNQSLIAPGGPSQPKPATDLITPTARTANLPTPSMNLERSGAKKMAARKRTLRGGVSCGPANIKHFPCTENVGTDKVPFCLLFVE